MVVNNELQSIVFCGTTPNIGTTVVAFSTAVSFARSIPGKIGYLCLNLKSSKLHHYVNESPKYTLDRLQPELQATCLTEQRLLSVMSTPLKEFSNLYVLYGNQLREMAERYTPTEISHLLEVASRVFTKVIIDVNAYLDNAATVQSLLQADARIVVTTGNYTHFHTDWQGWIHRIKDTYNLPIKVDAIVVTQWQDQSYIHSYSDLVRSMGFSTASRISYSLNLPLHLARGDFRRIISDHHFRREILSVVNQLIPMPSEILQREAS
jgi:hypothetical protein